VPRDEKYVFDLRDDDVYWCTADVGWVTGHSYIVYGPLSCGATCMMYEGRRTSPTGPLLEHHRAPRRHDPLHGADGHPRVHPRGRRVAEKHDLSSLRLLGSVGEPINPEAWIWYHRVIGGERCPIVDTWWQTETGSIMLTTLPGRVLQQAREHGAAVLRRRHRVVKDAASPAAERGRQARHPRPWPSMARTLWGDDERYLKTYWDVIPGVYFTGDGARATRTATSGSSAASTTCSTSPGTASAPPRSRARS
jgi:acetyl-CoA synthetase